MTYFNKLKRGQSDIQHTILIKLTLLLFSLIFSTNLLSQMTLEYNLDLSAGTTITLPLYGTVDVTVDWGDGNSEAFTTTGNKDHTYATGGTKTVSISGMLTQFGNGNYYSASKLIKVISFGNIGLLSLNGAFVATPNLSEVPDILPNTIIDLTHTFYGSGIVILTGLNNWNVSNITNMSGTFELATAFNQDISSWDVSGVTDMSSMFESARAFNQDLNSWNVGSVTNMKRMFCAAQVFNQQLNSWNVSNVTNMDHLFWEAVAFDQDISSWDVSSVQIWQKCSTEQQYSIRILIIGM